VALEAVVIDLDIDSDNNNRLAAPDESPKEEGVEETTGKKVVVSDNSTDNDNIPDYADGFGNPAPVSGIAGKSFVPIVLKIPTNLPVNSLRVTLAYADSAPGDVGPGPAFSLPEGDDGLIRLWKKNASVGRDSRSVVAGGDFVPADALFNDVTKLGFSDSIREVTLYVEGVRTSAGELVPITLTVTSAGGYSDDDFVAVVVVSNTLVIGIDGTGSAQWLAKKDANENLVNERNTQDGTRWNSHVRNLVADSDPFAMKIYSPGPAELYGGDSDEIFATVCDEARNMINDAGGGTTIAIVGWSRGAMIGLGVADALLTLAATDLPRTVTFVGLYDPVDMADKIKPEWARVHRDVKAITIVGPTADRQTEDAFNVDYDVMDGGLINPHFVRMARGVRITTADNAATAVQRIFYNASHGALGGTPGYNRRHRDGGDFPKNYNYALDVKFSIRTDKDIRADMRAAGLTFVPVRDDTWYGFPTERPPEDHRE